MAFSTLNAPVHLDKCDKHFLPRINIGISPFVLSIPDIDTYSGVMHSLFALEDMCGLQIDKIDGVVCLRPDKHSDSYSDLSGRFRDWKNEATKFKQGEITKKEYDNRRYSYPLVEVERQKQHRDEARQQSKLPASEQ